MTVLLNYSAVKKILIRSVSSGFRILHKNLRRDEKLGLWKFTYFKLIENKQHFRIWISFLHDSGSFLCHFESNFLDFFFPSLCFSASGKLTSDISVLTLRRSVSTLTLLSLQLLSKEKKNTCKVIYGKSTTVTAHGPGQKSWEWRRFLLTGSGTDTVKGDKSFCGSSFLLPVMHYLLPLQLQACRFPERMPHLNPQWMLACKTVTQSSKHQAGRRSISPAGV